MAMRNIPSLDGIRAISIAAVIIGHICNRTQTSETIVGLIAGNSSLGVNIFFVISGFLITHLLLREKATYGSISLGNFYKKRAFRIIPAYYFYLCIICIAAYFGWFEINKAQGISAFLFLQDYLPRIKAWQLVHLWSLAVEEQFYLLWPLTLVLCLRKNLRTAQWISVTIIVLAPLLRAGTYATHSFYATQIYFMLHTRLDSLMFGCLVALSEGERWFERIYSFFARYIYLLIIFLFVISPLLTHRFGGAYIYLVGLTLEGASIAMAMLWLVRNPQSVTGRWMNMPFMKRIGVLSYSLYIWQMLFLHEGNQTFSSRFPINLVAITACALISYYCIESPALRLRRKFTDEGRA
jgi:peptidoglycan/LPS O-acetylase OafA/YrhL